MVLALHERMTLRLVMVMMKALLDRLAIDARCLGKKG